MPTFAQGRVFLDKTLYKASHASRCWPAFMQSKGHANADACARCPIYRHCALNRNGL